MAGESSHVLSGTLPISTSEMECISALASCHVDCVRIDAASDLPCDASELLHASEGALVLLSKVVAEKVEARAA